ncbi:MAG: hypothetical protein BA863_03020 [Desulfovibrio sp. S3730MH75]|nr:MAG: hypothetical protein BA863_03020 [Desulfovibrio sp. S3730MH75]
MIGDVVIRILEFAAKYAWASFVLSLLVIVLPNSAITKMGLNEIRSQHLGIWWIVLIFSASLWIASFSQKIVKNIIQILKDYRKAAFWHKHLAEFIESLSTPEKNWIRYCLYFNAQTVPCYRHNPVAQSLVNKDILVEGSGHVMSLPFHIKSKVWDILKRRIHYFISEEELADQRVGKQLEDFIASLGRP